MLPLHDIICEFKYNYLEEQYPGSKYKTELIIYDIADTIYKIKLLDIKSVSSNSDFMKDNIIIHSIYSNDVFNISEHVLLTGLQQLRITMCTWNCSHKYIYITSSGNIGILTITEEYECGFKSEKNGWSYQTFRGIIHLGYNFEYIDCKLKDLSESCKHIIKKINCSQKDLLVDIIKFVNTLPDTVLKSDLVGFIVTRNFINYNELIKLLTMVSKFSNKVLESELILFIIKYIKSVTVEKLIKLLSIANDLYYDKIRGDELAIAHRTFLSHINMDDNIVYIKLFNIFAFHIPRYDDS